MQDPPAWMEDDREILTVQLAATPSNVYSALAGSRFERFERPGEYCYLPWIRVFSPTGNTLESPLTHVQLLAYFRDSDRDREADETGTGSVPEGDRARAEGIAQTTASETP